jgi:DNA-binding transcriptional LysR family regulator
VTLTPAGTRLYVEARKLLAQAEEVEALMAGLRGEEQPVRLATSHTIAEYVLPGPLVEFEQKRERHLSVELVIANSLVVRELVREGRAEFGIAAVDAGAAPDGVLRELPFCDDAVVVAVPSGHPWEKLDAVPIDELVRTPMVMRDPSANTRRTIEAALEGRGLALAPPLAEVGSTSAAKATAISEGAPVLLSRLAVRGNGERLVERPVEGIDFARRFVLLMGAHETLRPAARALIDHLVKTTG